MPTVLELYEKLKPKLGEEEARALLEFVETSVGARAATKEDLHRGLTALKEELTAGAAAQKDDLQRSILALRDEVRESIGALREELVRTEARLREHSQTVKVDTLKRSFAFWVGAVGILSGVMLAVVRAVR